VGIAALVCIFVAAPLVGTGHALDLILLAAVAMVGVVAWRPLQAWAARLEAGPAPNDGMLEQRLQRLEALVDAMSKQQMQLQETVRWQAQLLEHASAAPVTPPPPGPHALA
jgi:hypothetical protein